MSIVKPALKTRCLSSLSKVFADEDIGEVPFQKGSALLNETYAFQVAYRSHEGLRKNIKVRVESDLKDNIRVRSVGLVPSEFPIYNDHDDAILRATPGLYPDPLYPLDHEGLTGFPDQWRSIWVTVRLEDDVQPGLHQIKVVFEDQYGEPMAAEDFELAVIPAVLPEQQLLYTNWFHADCLATHYHVDVFSEEHWQLIDQYVKTAAAHGMNMILTPLFTPPLDTEVGGERPTVQLVDVEKSGSTYHFNFEKLTRWIDLCIQRGIRYFEFSHFFTQWGAKHAPKIIAAENGRETKIFGWETEASGGEYRNFLSQFLTALISFISEYQLEQQVYFHVSDEPNLHHVTSYQKASDILHDYLADFPIIDALSDYAFYEKGIVQHPIPSTDHIEPFLANDVPDLWTYYCCSQYKEVSNRFFAFPSARNRIIGMQLYKFHISGFLHWGFNFWYSQFSRKMIDPFRVTDSDKGFPSGDPFLVYPGDTGPIESIRLEVFFEALQDLRALRLLETLIGEKEVIDFIEAELEQPLTFKEYPVDAYWLLSIREAINQKIASVKMGA